jgi:hypothetical protein
MPEDRDRLARERWLLRRELLARRWAAQVRQEEAAIRERIDQDQQDKHASPARDRPEPSA